MPEKTYLGDGVYAEFDGFQIWLEAESSFGMKMRIALEPSVFDALYHYAERIATAAREQEININATP